LKYLGYRPKKISAVLRTQARSIRKRARWILDQAEIVSSKFNERTEGFSDVREFCGDFGTFFTDLAKELTLLADFFERRVERRHVDQLQHQWELCILQVDIADTFREQCLPDCQSDLRWDASDIWKSVNFELKQARDDIEELFKRLRMFEGNESESEIRAHDPIRLRVEKVVHKQLANEGGYRSVLKALDEAGEGLCEDRLFLGYKEQVPEIECWLDIANHEKLRANFQTWLSKMKKRRL